MDAMDFNVANLIDRERGSYAEDEQCLVCGELVDAMLPHIFVRDASPELSDDDAFVGLLRVDCRQRFLAQAADSGVH